MRQPRRTGVGRREAVATAAVLHSRSASSAERSAVTRLGALAGLTSRRAACGTFIVGRTFTPSSQVSDPPAEPEPWAITPSSRRTPARPHRSATSRSGKQDRRWLTTNGMGTGDRVAFLAGNTTDASEALFGCATLNAILVRLDWRLTVPELQLTDSSSRMRTPRRAPGVGAGKKRGTTDNAGRRAWVSSPPSSASRPNSTWSIWAACCAPTADATSRPQPLA